MRTTPVLLALIAASSIAAADTAADLAPGEVKAELARVDADVARCYLGAIGDRAGAGRLDLVLTIHRKGIVDHVDVRAPGLPAKLVQKIELCVREALADVTFPARRIGTTAVVPYYWQKTAAPGAGPQASCWNPKGCKS